MTLTNQKVAFLLKESKWHEERKKLREIALDSGLEEHVKWGKLCYCYQDSNVVMIYGLKDDCALGFFKGPLLKDTKRILTKPGENSRAMRWVKFKSIDDIKNIEQFLKSDIKEAIDLEKAGAKIDFKENRELKYPMELLAAFEKSPTFKSAFEALTPGRKRGYTLHFSGAKQSQTRISRIKKATPKILDGKGLNDR